MYHSFKTEDWVGRLSNLAVQCSKNHVEQVVLGRYYMGSLRLHQNIFVFLLGVELCLGVKSYFLNDDVSNSQGYHNILHLGSGQNVPPEHRYRKLGVCLGKGLGSLETSVGDPWPGTFSAWSWE